MVVLDVRLPGEDGLAALPKFRQATGNAPCIVITAFGDLETAVKALQGGAADYLIKPFRIQDVLQVCRGVLTQSQPQAPVTNKESALRASSSARLVGSSPAMQQVYRQIALVADSDLSVLITGETGVGKELVAAAIHAHSSRKSQPYLPIAPVALSPNLIESELFGHVKGAFTGATENRNGLFALAQGGTILLDEIGDLPLGVQVKLLRVLEQREYTAVGDVRPRPCDVRILAATNSDLQAAGGSGSFREDLYYRLAAVEIKVPPLRERLEDLELLVQHFLQQANHPYAGSPLDTELLKELRQRPWYGNVRELRNTMDHAAVVSRARPLTVDHLPPPQPMREGTAQPLGGQVTFEKLVQRWAEKKLSEPSAPAIDLYENLMSEIEPALFKAVLQQTQGNRAAAAELLGIHRGTLRERMNRYGLEG